MLKKLTSFLMLVSILPTELTASEDFLLGFELGGTIKQAHNHALSKNWRLRPRSEHLPNEWIVEGANGELLTCDDKVLAVRRQFEGGIDKFTKLVEAVQLERGSPKTTIVARHTPLGRISTIDARFKSDDTSELLIQLRGTDDTVQVRTDFFSGAECFRESE